MNSETKRKEEWTVGLQFFLSSRLRTQPFAVASRTHPQVTLPAMVPNTQYLLDGIVWSLNDHPSWAADAWLSVQNHLRDAAERLEELAAQLDSTRAVRQKRKEGPANTQSRAAREQTYGAHAAVQDVYLAFCVVDAMLKGCGRSQDTATSSNAAAAAAGSSAVRDTIERELPHLVSDYFPIFAAYPEEHTPLLDAVEEYRLMFLGLLESWAVMHTLAPHTVRRLEEHIRHKLKSSREGEEEEEDDEDAGDGDDSEEERPARRTDHSRAHRAVQESLEILLHGALRGPAAAAAQRTTGGAGGGRLKAPRSAEMAERNIKSFLSSIFPSKKQPVVRITCPHCGAPFKDEKSKNAHYRYHFHNHNVMRGEDKVVRLSYPAPEDFIVHVGDYDQSGYFPKATELLEEAYKNDDKGTLKVRRLDDGSQKVRPLSL